MEKRNDTEKLIVKDMYNTVSAMKPLTYTELRGGDSERYFSFEIMLDEYDFDTDTLETKLEDFFEEHDEIDNTSHRLQFKDYDVINENGFKELNVIFRALN